MLASVFMGLVRVHTPFEVAMALIAALASYSPLAVAGTCYDFLRSQFRRKTLSGVSSEVEWLRDMTGHYPAVLGLEATDNDSLVANAVNHWNRGGIPIISWHWPDPSRTTSEVLTAARFNVSAALDPSTAEHAAVIRDVRALGQLLAGLRSRKVAALFRPLPSAASGRYWWDSAGPAAAVELYGIVFGRLFHHHHLNNLIWIWSTDARPGAADWFPRFVDIIGVDVMGGGDHAARADAFALEIGRGARMLAITECESVPAADAMKETGAVWSFCVARAAGEGGATSPDFWRAQLANEAIVTLNGIPGWPQGSSSREFRERGARAQSSPVGRRRTPRTAAAPEVERIRREFWRLLPGARSSTGPAGGDRPGSRGGQTSTRTGPRTLGRGCLPMGHSPQDGTPGRGFVRMRLWGHFFAAFGVEPGGAISERVSFFHATR
jgi:hypothetical protein